MDTLRKHFSWIIVIFASLMFMLGLLYNTFIPEIIVLILIVLTGIFMIFSRKKVVLLGKIIISVALLVASAFLFYTQYAAERLIKYNPTETSVITFVVLKESALTQLGQAAGKIFGVSAMMDNTTNLYLKDQVSSKVKEFESGRPDESGPALQRKNRYHGPRQLHPGLFKRTERRFREQDENHL
jgi:hypothetical protein